MVCPSAEVFPMNLTSGSSALGVSLANAGSQGVKLWRHLAASVARCQRDTQTQSSPVDHHQTCSKIGPKLHISRSAKKLMGPRGTLAFSGPRSDPLWPPVAWGAAPFDTAAGKSKLWPRVVASCIELSKSC